MSTEQIASKSPERVLETEKVYHIMGCLGVIRTIQDIALRDEFVAATENEEYASIRYLSTPLQSLANDLNQPWDFKIKFNSNGVTHHQITRGILSMMGQYGQMLDDDYYAAICLNAGSGVSSFVNAKYEKLRPIFEKTVFPFYSERFIEHVLSEEIIDDFMDYFISGIPTLEGNIRHYIGEYDPERKQSFLGAGFAD